MNAQLLLNVIFPSIVIGLLTGILLKYIPAKHEKIFIAVFILICISFVALTRDTSQSIPENILDRINDLKQMFSKGMEELGNRIDADRKQRDQAKNMPEEYRVEHDKIAENSTPRLPSPTVLPVELKEEQQSVVEKQQSYQERQISKAEREQIDKMSNLLLIPDAVFIDRKEKTNIYVPSSAKSNTKPVKNKADGIKARHTTKALKDFQRDKDIQENSTVAQVNIPKVDKFDVSALKSAGTDRTPSVVNPHVVEQANDGVVQTNILTNFVTNEGVFGGIPLTIETFRDNSFSDSTFVTNVTNEGVFSGIPQIDGRIGSRLGSRTPIHSPASNLGMATGWSTGLLPSLPSVGQSLHTIHPRR